MRHLGLFLMGSLALAACSNKNTPPAESSYSVASATNEPNRGPDFSPSSSDGLATAPAETRRTATGATAAGTNTTGTDTTGTNTTGNTATQPAPNLDTSRDQREGVDRTTANAAAAPTDRTTDRTTGTPHDADNSRVNSRDRSSAALTPMDQGGSEADRKITQQIRQDLMKDGSLSFTAKNVKVITLNGRVTLRGPVKSEAERSAIEAAARRAAGSGAQVDSQLEISK